MFAPGLERFRRTTRWILALCLCAAPAFALPTKLGDLNSDGVLDVFDLTRLREHIRQTNSLPQNLVPFADITADGFINDDDSVALIYMIVGASPEKALPLDSIRETSPFAGESGVALTREVIVRFTMPLSLNAVLTTWDPNTQTPGTFYAEAGGRKLLTRVELSGDRLKATLFFLEIVPASTRVLVTFNGAGLNDLLERPIDPEGDGAEGGTHTFTYDSAPITPVIGTGIIGHVYASERAEGQTTDTPLAGVLVRVVGSETLFTYTAVDGSFSLNPCPVGRFFVEVDGRESPASDFPNGDYYPYVGKAWEALPGRLDNLAAGTGQIYLPLVHGAAFQPVSPVQETIITVGALPGVQLIVPANDLFSDDGTRGGNMTMAAVASDRLPEPLPPGLNFPQVITIQTDGATNFDRPVPVRFPNLPDSVTGMRLPPGVKSALWSFNHDKGTWEIAGPMTVTEDGNFVVTDVGVGVRQPGWHGTNPGSQGNPRSADDPHCDVGGSEGGHYGDAADILRDGIYLFNEPIEPYLKFFGDHRYKIIKDLTRMARGLSYIGVIDSAGRCARDVAGGHITLACALTITSGLETFVPITAPFLAPISMGLIIAEMAEEGEEEKAVCDEEHSGQQIGGRTCAVIHPLPRNHQRLAPNRGASADDAFARTDEAAALARASFDVFTAESIIQAPLWEQIQAGYNAAEPIRLKIAASTLDPSAPRATGAETLEMLARMKDATDAAAELEDRPSVGWLYEEALAKADLFRVEFDKVVFDTNPSLQFPERVHYLLQSRGLIQRFSGNSGSASALVFQPDTIYVLSAYAVTSKRVGRVFFKSPPNGGQRALPVIVFETDEVADDDGDGLSNNAEEIIGTNRTNMDSDGDGMSDGAEVQNGTNPLDGLPSQTGVLTSVDTPGNAKDIAAQNSIALVADSSEGVSVFNVANALNPVRTAQIRLTGSTEAVALDGTRAVATGSSLSLLDLSNLSDVRVTMQLSLGSNPRAVVATGGVAYAGLNNGQIVAVDMAAGTELERRQVSTEPIHDLSFAGDVLYVRSTSRVYAVELAPSGMNITGSVAVNGNLGAGGSRPRLFAGGGIAYSTFTSGYDIISLADPRHPALAGSVNTQQFGWKQIVANGSGLGLAAVGPNSTSDGPHDVSLYNVGPDGTTSQFLTTFVTPGLAEAVSIYDGLAYVADGDAGLTVVNYKAYDALGLPPTITVRAGFPMVNGVLQAEEGKLGRVAAAVTDDVQVRSVEFYVDGQLAVTDGNFPFEHRFTTPLLAPGKTSFTLRGKATDTGGNSTWSATLTVNLVADATPPHVLSFLPPTGSYTGSLRNIVATFSEPIDQATLTAASFAITGAGPDGIFNTADDFVPMGGGISYRESSNAAFVSFPQDLPPSLYRLVVSPPVADLAGNTMAVPAQTQFRVFSFQDSDGDGIPDEVELLLGLDPSNPDSDGNGVRDGEEDFDHDGLTNAQEIALGLDPRDPHSNGDPNVLDGDADPDHDGLSNRGEALAGTDPNNPDSDGDGWNDETEVTAGSNPLDAQSRPIGLIASTPEINVMRVGDFTSGVLGNGATIAQPPVFINRVLGEGFGTFIAQPEVFVEIQNP